MNKKNIKSLLKAKNIPFIENPDNGSEFYSGSESCENFQEAVIKSFISQSFLKNETNQIVKYVIDTLDPVISMSLDGSCTYPEIENFFLKMNMANIPIKILEAFYKKGFHVVCGNPNFEIQKYFQDLMKQCEKGFFFSSSLIPEISKHKLKVNQVKVIINRYPSECSNLLLKNKLTTRQLKEIVFFIKGSPISNYKILNKVLISENISEEDRKDILENSHFYLGQCEATPMELAFKVFEDLIDLRNKHNAEPEDMGRDSFIFKIKNLAPEHLFDLIHNTRERLINDPNLPSSKRKVIELTDLL